MESYAGFTRDTIDLKEVKENPLGPKVHRRTNIFADSSDEEEDTNNDVQSKSTIISEQDQVRYEAILGKLNNFHPRAMEPGAQYPRSQTAKDYAKTFSLVQWEIVHDRVIALGVKTAERIRKKYEAKIESLDLMKVFNAESNKVRIRAQMIVDLQRDVKYPTLEDAVIIEMGKSAEQEEQPQEPTVSKPTLIEPFKPTGNYNAQSTNDSKYVIQNDTPKDKDKLMDFEEYCKLQRQQLFNTDEEVLQTEQQQSQLLASSMRKMKFRKPRRPHLVGDPELIIMPEELRAAHEPIEYLNLTYSIGSKEVVSHPQPEVDHKPSQIPKDSPEANTIPETVSKPEYFNDLIRIFDQLAMPAQQRLAFVLKYSDPENASHLGEALVDWHAAVDLVIFYEDVLRASNLARQGHWNESMAFPPRYLTLLEQHKCSLTTEQLYGEKSEQWLRAVVKKFAPICQQHLERLQTKWGDTLTYRGHEYAAIRYARGGKKDQALPFVGSAVYTPFSDILTRE